MSDALLLYKDRPQPSIISAASQLQGDRETQEDYFVNYNDECFVVCDGVGWLPHGEVAAKLAADTAAWAYKHVRQRRTYWKDRKLFLKRIFRTTNITVWQKQREEGFEGGMATTMLLCIIIDRHFYVGNAGDSSAFLVQNGVMTKLTAEDVDAQGRLTKTIGTVRYGLTPSVASGEFLVGDTMMLMTDGIAREFDADKCATFLRDVGNTASELSDTALAILRGVKNGGSTDNMTVVLIKRIA